MATGKPQPIQTAHIAVVSAHSPGRHSFTLPFLLVALLLGVAVGASPAKAEPAGAEVVVVHGVPGLTVDVYVDGTLTLPSFTPSTVTDPIPLPAGSYDIAIVPEGGDPSSPAISGQASVLLDNVHGGQDPRYG